MKISSNLLLDDITHQLEQYIAEAEALKALPLTHLNWRATETAWSVLECLEHLSLYADFYVPEIKKVSPTLLIVNLLQYLLPAGWVIILPRACCPKKS